MSIFFFDVTLGSRPVTNQTSVFTFVFHARRRYSMGWWPFGNSSAQEDPTPPTRQERQKCWESRDAYFACLDGVGVIRAGTEGKSCSAENRAYHETCAQSWVGLSAPVQNKANVADSARSRISTSVVSSHLTRRICLLRQMRKILPPSDELKPKRKTVLSPFTVAHS